MSDTANSESINENYKKNLRISIAELLITIFKVTPSIIQASYEQFYNLYENSLISIGDIVNSVINDDKLKINCVILLSELCKLGTR